MARSKPKFHKERPLDQSNVEADWRLFIAIPLPLAVQALTARLIEGFAARNWPIRWVAADSSHLTLHFIGEVPPERAELLRMGLASTVARNRAFRLDTASLGVFPDIRNPRVLWLGLRGQTDALAALNRDLGRQLQRLDFEVEARELHPHVTLGRVREPAPSNLGGEIRQAFEDPAIRTLIREEASTFEVSEVALVRSFLERGGARHVSIAAYPLARP
jgi:2'-5' RNA ligase